MDQSGSRKIEIPGGGYVMLHLNEDSSNKARDRFRVESIRFTLRIETAAIAVEDTPLPHASADMLRLG